MSSNVRRDFKDAFGAVRLMMKDPRAAQSIDVGAIPLPAFKAALAARCTMVDETHGIMCWTPAGRTREVIDGRKWMIRYGFHRRYRRPVKPLPR